MVNKSKNVHLTKEEIIKSGSVYTGSELVDLVFNQAKKYIDNETVIGDFGSGYGAFLEKFKSVGKRCFATELDNLSYQFLIQNYPEIKVYHENSLQNVDRTKYNLKPEEKLFAIGNPPYNDTTSIFRKGQKGVLVCDNDLASRDFGISFLKAYNKLNAEYICVLHPLAYLIKNQNFKALGSFTNNYRLESGCVFSSKEFESITKSYSDFPVVSALYKRNPDGMNYDYIKNFRFEILKSSGAFILNKVLTIDGIVDKYPKKHNDPSSVYSSNLFGEVLEDSKPKLQFYTLRDMNALMRNAAFVEGIIPNGIDVTIENLYQYSWLFFLKNNFKPERNKFLFGNLSPLYTKKLEDKEFKRQAVYYSYNNNNIVKKCIDEEKIKALYGDNTNQYNALYSELDNLYAMFD